VTELFDNPDGEFLVLVNEELQHCQQSADELPEDLLLLIEQSIHRAAGDTPADLSDHNLIKLLAMAKHRIRVLDTHDSRTSPERCQYRGVAIAEHASRPRTCLRGTVQSGNQRGSRLF
jgi:hypothetical protein